MNPPDWSDWKFLLLFIPVLIIWAILRRPKKDNTIGWSLYASKSFKWLVIFVMSIMTCIFLYVKVDGIGVGVDQNGHWIVWAISKPVIKQNAKDSIIKADSAIYYYQMAENIYKEIGDKKKLQYFDSSIDEIKQDQMERYNLLLSLDQDTIPNSKTVKLINDFYSPNNGAIKLDKAYGESKLLYLQAVKSKDSAYRALKIPLFPKGD